MVENRIETCKYHIKRLEEKLTRIYTVELLHVSPKESLENVDVREVLKDNNLALNVYSKLESEGIKQGETYEKYNTYLTNARYGAEQLEKVIKEIEQENAAEIKNINILLQEFRIELGLLSQ